MKRLAVVFAISIATPAIAQHYPSRPIRMMVPAAAGVTDFAARVRTPRLYAA